ncbi:hypothetical protein GH714_040737 [Hevea brasiliensis]|uniref:PB1-like domain-containing protein n=1 Tax=Hevea brasiliensis TaxID=3981 RepID=A0A6A6MPZ7_HEVBR|nr:hypothetical protein GH714_040737 [Hevea brasiliensis]
MSIYVNLNSHHGGKWVFKPMMVYEGGQIEYKDYVDIDFLSHFELQSYAKELHYDYCRIWFRILGLSGDEAFEEIENDSQVNNMLDYNSSADEIDIYFVENAKLVTFIHEHVSHVEKDNDEHIAAIEKDSEVTDVNRDKDSAANEGDSQVADVNRDKDSAANERDSEVVDVNRDRDSIANERDSEVADDKGDKESFNVDMDSDSTDSDYNINSDADEDGSSEFCIGSSDISEMYIDLKGENTRDYEEFCEKAEDLNEDDYEEFCEKAANEDELHSLHSASEDDVPYPEFNESFGFANPQLCMGMKFSSHIIFRRALKEWAIRNGFGFKLLKNTSTRITAICHHLCGFKTPMGGQLLCAVGRDGNENMFPLAIDKQKGLIETFKEVGLGVEHREQPEKYVYKYFHKDTYLAIYNYVLHPLPRQHDWEKTNLPDIQPAMVRKPADRPKKRRIRAIDEPRNPFKLTRARGTVYCGNCKQKGHNVRGCKAALTGDTPWQRRQRLNRAKKMGEQNINEGHNVTQSTSTTGSPPSKNGQNMLRKKHRLMKECTTSASQPTTSTIDNV